MLRQPIGIYLTLSQEFFWLFWYFCVWFCRSAEGAIHIWNLNSRRAEKIIEGHSGSSVMWVSTLQSTEALIRSGGRFASCLHFLLHSSLLYSVWCHVLFVGGTVKDGTWGCACGIWVKVVVRWWILCGPAVSDSVSAPCWRQVPGPSCWRLLESRQRRLDKGTCYRGYWPGSHPVHVGVASCSTPDKKLTMTEMNLRCLS